VNVELFKAPEEEAEWEDWHFFVTFTKLPQVQITRLNAAIGFQWYSIYNEISN
jgi:hypothetical protein